MVRCSRALAAAAPRSFSFWWTIRAMRSSVKRCWPATQNQMELEAPIQALKMVTGRHPPFEPSRYRKVVIKTDATYVTENFGTAAGVWSRNGWMTREGKPVDNAPQWKELVRLAVLSSKQGKRVSIVRVPGKKSPRTKAVDRLAK